MQTNVFFGYRTVSLTAYRHTMQASATPAGQTELQRLFADQSVAQPWDDNADRPIGEMAEQRADVQAATSTAELQVVGGHAGKNAQWRWRVLREGGA